MIDQELGVRDTGRENFTLPSPPPPTHLPPHNSLYNVFIRFMIFQFEYETHLLLCGYGCLLLTKNQNVVVSCFIQGNQGPMGQFGMMGRKGTRVSIC